MLYITEEYPQGTVTVQTEWKAGRIRMPKDYSTLPRTKLRRSDREVSDEVWIKAFLQRAPVGTLATIHDGQPFLNSNIFVYDETKHVIYLHTARMGRTRANIEIYDRVCFSVYE